VHTLSFCAKVDNAAGSFEKIIRIYVKIMQTVVNSELNKDLAANNDEGESVDYLLTSPPATPNGATSTLRRAGADLICLVRRPFARTGLELVPEDNEIEEFEPQMRATLVNWMEAAMGAPQEWSWELQNSGVQGDSVDAVDELADSSSIAGVMSRLTPGQFIAGERSTWQMWPPNAY
jgi:hypothetical protein